MKSQNRISQLTLELYYRGLATSKERKLVEKALAADSNVRQRYEELQKQDREIRQLVLQELKRQNIQQTLPVMPPQKKMNTGLLIAAAAILLCALIPALLYLRNNSSKKDNVIAEETTEETNTEEETNYIDNEPNVEVALPPEQPVIRERDSSNSITEIVESLRNELRVEPERTAEPELRIDPDSGISVAAMPEPDTGIHFRGEGQSGNQGGATTAPESTAGTEGQGSPTVEPSNLNIPPGITFIFDNMFANSGLTFIIIPSRIISIGKNAFSGNPLLSVSIGANVSIEDNAIPGNFAGSYNANDKAAGTYTRSDTSSEAWEKK